MLKDEGQHAENAKQAGAARLPVIVRSTIGLIASVMKTTSYKI